MNKIIFPKKKIIKGFEKGDLFRDERDGIYILCKPSENSFAAICLNDGVRWSESSKDVNAVVDGLTFLGRSATIRVSF